MTWTGRELTGLSGNGLYASFKYDADGLRTEKAAGGVTSKYYYVGGKLYYEKRGAKELYYFYDSIGNLAMIRYYTGSGEENYNYYVATNSRGDVEAIYRGNGTVKARYIYDTWGKVVSVVNENGQEITNQNDIGLINPIRYRGYYYDQETGYYYLQSRYYDPDTGRFLNGDGYANTGVGVLGTNMFMYCGNNPVNNVDPTGRCYYNANGVWCHDNWESLHGYIKKADPRIVKKQEQLTEMGFKNVTLANATDYYNTLKKYDINTKEHEAHFLAQCAKETNFGTWLLEYGSDSYLQSKSYYPYYGAGYIQITWDYNYKAFSESVGDPNIYTKGPAYVAENYAWSVAGWFWSNNNINSRINNGATVKDVTRMVRGSSETWEERQSYYNRIYGVLR